MFLTDRVFHGMGQHIKHKHNFTVYMAPLHEICNVIMDKQLVSYAD